MGISCDDGTVTLFLPLLRESGSSRGSNLKTATGVSASAGSISSGGPPSKPVLGALGRVDCDFHNPGHPESSKTGAYSGRLLLFWRIQESSRELGTVEEVEHRST